MPTLVKAALCGLIFALVILVTFTVPQALKLWLKQAAQAEGAAVHISLAVILGWAAFPALVAGGVMFGVSWYFLARVARDHGGKPKAP